MAIFETALPGARDRTPLALLAAFAAVAGLAFIVLRWGGGIWGGDGAALDGALLLAMRVPGHSDTPIGPFWLRQVMIDITGLGGGTPLTLFVILAAGVLLVRRAIRTALLLVMGTASGGLIVDLLKDRFARPRPALVDHLVDVQSASFPSAHAANSAIVFLTMAALVSRIEATRGERSYTFAAAILLTLAVGSTRVYLGVHWPSDVAAGWLLGTGWALLWWVIAQALAPSVPSPVTNS